MMMKPYIRLAKKWFWLVILGAVIAGGAAYFAAERESDVYESVAKIFVGSAIDSIDPDLGTLRLAPELASIYGELISTTDFLQGVIDRLQLEGFSINRLRNMVSVTTFTGRPFMEIVALSTDPQLSADVANAAAAQLIETSPANPTDEELKQLELYESQIEKLREQADVAFSEIKAIDAEVEKLDPQRDADRIAVLQNQRSTYVDQFNLAQSTIATYSSLSDDIRSRPNRLTLVESAVPAASPSQRNAAFTRGLLGAIAGAGLAIGAVLAIEYLNTTIRNSEEAAKTLGLPILGTIARFGSRKDTPRDRLITRQTQSLVLEGYRTLQTNLLYAAGEDHKGMYIITSPNEDEGKSTTAANLAATMALSGLRVLLIDADFHKPKLHEIFDLDNTVGMATLLATPLEGLSRQGRENNKAVPDSVSTGALLKCIQTTSVPNLSVLTSGTAGGNLTPAPGGVFLLHRFSEWVEILQNFREIDVVLFDTPPSLASVDSSILAATTAAEVIMVLEAGRTTRDAAIRAKGQFSHIGREIRGVVLNKTPRSEVDHGYGYGYYDDLQTLNVRPSRLRQKSQTDLPAKKVGAS